MTLLKKFVFAAILLAALAAGGWYWWQQQQSRLSDYIASGNGRIEAEEVHVATKYPLRIAEVLVDEGDMVEAGQILARMDTAEEEAALEREKANAAKAELDIAEAKADIAQRESELMLARHNLDRALRAVRSGAISREIVDQRRTAMDTARAALDAAQAHLAASEKARDAVAAEAKRIQIKIDDCCLAAPRRGRVQYRLAKPGEVLDAGGRVVTILDLTDVYMTIFLPSTQVGRVAVGSQARIILDAVPQYVIPARVSFVAAKAQFTPREVETRTEREKLMFRVKVQIDPELLLAHIEQVKTGLPGEAYVMLGSGGPWPEYLAVKLPPPATE